MSNNFIKLGISFIITTWIAQNVAFANIYKHVDEFGNETFTNDPKKGSILILTESPKNETQLDPINFLAETLSKSKTEKELRDLSLKFIRPAYNKLKKTSANLKKKSIDISTFKNEKYFKVELESTMIYNNARLDKYAIGKTLFDNAIRNLISPLNDTLGDSKSIVGYDLIIYGHSKDFFDKSSKEEKTEYRFLINSNVARQYKNKDISDQKMLDESVILMNSDRIELKLQ